MMFACVAMVQGLVNRPDARDFRNTLTSKKLVKLHPPLTGLLRRLHCEVAQTQAEGLVALDVSFGASARQIRPRHFLADPWNLSPEYMQVQPVECPGRLGHSSMTD